MAYLVCGAFRGHFGDKHSSSKHHFKSFKVKLHGPTPNYTS